MCPRPDVSEERRAQILDAATTVFARAGFSSARMDDIAERASLSKGTLYLYFKSKDALIVSLMERLYALQLEDLRHLEASAEPFAERLLAFARHAVSQYEAMEPAMPIVREFYALAARRKDVRAAIRRSLETFRTLLTALVEQGIARGEVRKVDADAAALTILAIYEGLGVLWTIAPRVVRLREQTESAIHLLLSGLLRNDAAQP
jgi:AcrR family transcriptional regulator